MAKLTKRQQAFAGKVDTTKLYAFDGLKRIDIQEAAAGDIVAFSGIENLRISDTLCDRNQPEALPALQVDEPTLTMDFMVNSSPLAGTEGKFVTSRQIRDRLYRELESNVALRVEDTADADVFRVSGRGELHLTILLENMRREGYELAVSRPRVEIPTPPRRCGTPSSSRMYRASPTYSLAPGLPPCTTKFAMTRWKTVPS